MENESVHIVNKELVEALEEVYRKIKEEEYIPTTEEMAKLIANEGLGKDNVEDIEKNGVHKDNGKNENQKNVA